jgi:hypothetical protein
LVKKNLKDWDLKLCHAEFAYNKSPSRATKISPFECVYGMNSLIPISLVNLPLHDKVHGDSKTHVENMMHIHKQTRENIKKATEQYHKKACKGNNPQHTYQVGDWV